MSTPNQNAQSTPSQQRGGAAPDAQADAAKKPRRSRVEIAEARIAAAEAEAAKALAAVQLAKKQAQALLEKRQAAETENKRAKREKQKYLIGAFVLNLQTSENAEDRAIAEKLVARTKEWITRPYDKKAFD